MRATDRLVVTLYGQPGVAAFARFGRRARVALTVADGEIWAEV